jgi:flagellar basal body-associated protein FliL
MKNTIITLIVIIVLVIAGYYLYTGFVSAPAEVPADGTTTEVPATTDGSATVPADETATSTN